MKKFNDYAFSALVTFVAGFVFAVTLQLGDVPMEQGALFALLLASFRAGIKGVFELAGLLLAEYRRQWLTALFLFRLALFFLFDGDAAFATCVQ